MSALTSKLPPLTQIAPFKGEVYRNIATCMVSQDLLDDLADTDEEKKVLQAWDNATSGIDHALPQTNRVFQYVDAGSTGVFSEKTWYGTRFSSGSFGVWYGADSRKASLLETFYWSIKLALEDLANANGPIIKDRSMYVAAIDCAKACDLRPSLQTFPDLVHPHDYSLCQAVGAAARAAGVEILLTYSARMDGATSIPVFTPDVIASDKKIGFHKFTIQTLDDELVAMIDDNPVSIPAGWGLALPKK